MTTCVPATSSFVVVLIIYNHIINLSKLTDKDTLSKITLTNDKIIDSSIFFLLFIIYSKKLKLKLKLKLNIKTKTECFDT